MFSLLFVVFKVVATGAGMVSPNRAPGTVSLSPARVPDVDPIDAAAHLQLLGESLSLIGHRLQETEVSLHMRAYLQPVVFTYKPSLQLKYKDNTCVTE